LAALRSIKPSRFDVDQSLGGGACEARLMPLPDRKLVAPIEGARPETPHPLRRLWRGAGELALFGSQALGAVLELLSGRGAWKPRRRAKAAEKVAPFPIND
jgi:hypothetical protein